MKVRDSGMPDEDYWETLFDVELAIERFGIKNYTDVAELGCGYGTFSIPIAKVIHGTLHCFDIDPFMVERTCMRAKGLPVRVELRDVFESGFGIKADAVVLFNILHCEDPMRLLSLAADAAPNILVTHWQSKQTPRGPSHEIRPTPTLISKWANDCGLSVCDQFELPPWHFGMVLRNQSKAALAHAHGDSLDRFFGTIDLDEAAQACETQRPLTTHHPLHGFSDPLVRFYLRRILFRLHFAVSARVEFLPEGSRIATQVQWLS